MRHLTWLPPRPFGVLLSATLLSVAGDGITYQLAPEHMRGRAVGTMTATALAATPFGALAAGALTGSLGLAAATAAFGGVYLLVTLVPVAFPLYRQMTGPRPVRP